MLTLSDAGLGAVGITTVLDRVSRKIDKDAQSLFEANTSRFLLFDTGYTQSVAQAQACFILRKHPPLSKLSCVGR